MVASDPLISSMRKSLTKKQPKILTKEVSKLLQKNGEDEANLSKTDDDSDEEWFAEEDDCFDFPLCVLRDLNEGDGD